MIAAVRSGETYTISRNAVSGNRFRLYAAQTFPAAGVPLYTISGSGDSDLSKTFTMPQGYTYLFVYLANDDSTITSNMQLEFGPTATAYEPYHGISPSIALGGTYYGGTVDLVSGVMTVTHSLAVYDGSSDESWSVETASAGTNFYIRVQDAQASTYNVLCSTAVKRAEGGTYTQGTCYISGARNFNLAIGDLISITTVSGFKTWLASHNVQLYYPLATPQTVTLTPQTIAALRGQQTVTSPAGSVEIGYWAQDDTVRQMSYGGIPVYRDNVAYANNGGMVDDFVQDSNYFIALCDTGTTASKDVTFLRIADTLTSGNNFSVRGFSDLSSRSIADWTAGGYETARTLTATARYFACPIKKSRAADMYMTVTIGGVTTYIYKGNNV